MTPPSTFSSRLLASARSDTTSPMAFGGTSLSLPGAGAARPGRWATRSGSISPSVRESSRAAPLRQTCTATFWPGLVLPTIRGRSVCFSTGLPSKRRMTSPSLSPAFSAAVLGNTFSTTAPLGAFKPSDSATSFVTAPGCTPRKPRVTRPLATNWSPTRIASSIGMANEIPWYPPERLYIIELMPTTSPRILINGPPELPGLIATSVWIKGTYSPVSRPLALTIPAVTVLSRSYGEPMAMTHSPTRKRPESPIVTNGRPVASTFTMATSVR